MPTAPCPRCGGLAPTGASFCPFCGSSLTAPVAAPASFAPSTPGYYVLSAPPTAGSPGMTLVPPPPPGSFLPTDLRVPNPSTREVDRTALTYLRWGAAVLVGSGVVSFLSLMGPGILDPTGAAGPGIGPGVGPFFYAEAIVSGAVALVEVMLFREVFRRLAPVDSRFEMPRSLTQFLLAGIGIVAVGVGFLIAGEHSVVGCTSNLPPAGIPSGCQVPWTLFAAGFVLLAGAVVVLIGLIGLLLGIWRLGSRYENDLFKAGTLLLIFPILNVVGKY
ncbi:MAG: zinc ribbon domain-containing protein, partial [Thermoplasmata archaeon]|nr:zinc ribbon domain-containing protein [Thermoplasmata archaeon]